MTDFRINIPLAHILPLDTPITRGVLQELERTVAAVAENAHAQWVAYANGTPLPDGRVIGQRTGTYSNSIQINKTGDFAYVIFSDAPHADAIEEGRPARDLKQMLDTSHKVRISKTGKRYLIIPFRWGTPKTVTFGKNVMPKAVHRLWQSTSRPSSHIIGASTRTVGHRIGDRQPLTVTDRKYLWGHRLGADELRGRASPQAARHMQGMVNLRQPGAKGGKSHSQFMTFRVMSEDSQGWQAPAIKGYHPARTVADRVREEAEKAFAEAAERDVQRILGGG